MSPNLAALLTWSFVAFLLIRNARHRSECLPGLWVPTIWILILGSRSPNQWFVGEGAGQSVDAYEDGNGFNQVVYLGLIVLATFVLLYRRVQWADIFRRNRALLVFLGYCIVSLVWADYPLVSFKGAIKAIFGNFVMAAVVVTDPRPVEAVKTMIRRCTYVLIPLSVLVIKYYPLIGRETHRWTYETMYMGVSAGPNGLATTCFVCGLVVLWNLFRKDTSETRVDRGIDVLMLLMIVWLLNKADGNTAFLSLVIALAIMLGLRRGLLTALVSGLARHMVAFLTVIAVSLALMYVWVIDALGAIVGSSATLWGRVELWKLLVSLSGNPILGMGYGNFWLGDRMQSLWAIYSWHPTQAHNGYLETYLNLGFLGVVLLIVLLASACRKATTPALLVDLRILKLSYMLPVVLYNLTEAAFRGLHIVWFVFLVLAMETQQQFLKGPSQAKPLQQPVGGGNRSAGRRWPATEAAMATRRTSSRAAGTRFARALR